MAFQGVMARAPRITGPIVVNTGEFEMLTTKDLGSGSIVVPSSTIPVPAWLVVTGSVVVALVICGTLALDRKEKADDAERLRLANGALESELMTLKSRIAVTDDLVVALERDRALLNARNEADARAATSAAALHSVMRDELKREINRGDARVQKRGAKVIVTLQASAVLDGEMDVSLRGVDVLALAGALLDHEQRVFSLDVYTDSANEHPWATTAMQAASIARFLEETVNIPAARMSANGHGDADPVSKYRARNRRVDLVVDYR